MLKILNTKMLLGLSKASLRVPVVSKAMSQAVFHTIGLAIISPYHVLAVVVVVNVLNMW